MGTVIDFLRESNRWKHLLGGFLIGLLGMHPVVALYASAVAASCLERRISSMVAVGTG